MKFFTFEWWSGGQTQTPDSDALNAYQKHLAKIRNKLPPVLLRLQEDVSLHDSKLRKFSFNTNDRSLTLRLDGYGPKGESLDIQLVYIDISDLNSTADPNRSLGGPGGYGDLSYDEADIHESGRFVHRILFSSGIELEIVFESMSVVYEETT